MSDRQKFFVVFSFGVLITLFIGLMYTAPHKHKHNDDMQTTNNTSNNSNPGPTVKPATGVCLGSIGAGIRGA